MIVWTEEVLEGGEEETAGGVSSACVRTAERDEEKRKVSQPPYYSYTEQ